ncbi:MAG: citrate (Si)-synthase [Calditrichaeota bacterium]|nr:MAG: citrate (Si)-synthase [Calditrichota bacterium]
MQKLRETLAKQIPQWREEVRYLLQRHADEVVSTISVTQLFKGLRGVRAVVCDTSYVDPEEGLFIRGIPVQQLVDRSAEEVFFLLCTGELPDEAATEELRRELERRRSVPAYVWNVIDSFPEDAHPMVLLSTAMLAMQRESHFQKRFDEGMSREDHWEPTLEDALNIIARLPVIAAGIYRQRLRGEPRIEPASGLDFSANFAHMLGLDDPREEFREFIRRFVVVHSDHEGANASVFTSRVVNSSLSDLYYSISGAMNCLAGPLHGLANQESVKFVLEIQERFGGVPDEKELESYVWHLLEEGRLIPGFGHAVLRSHDPRFVALEEFGQQVCPDDPVFQIVEKLARVVPPLLIKQGKAQNPYPNIDGISGTLLYHFGMRELKFYTVMFSVAQILGICAQLLINRAIFSPIIRPRSVTTRWLRGYLSDAL